MRVHLSLYAPHHHQTRGNRREQSRNTARAAPWKTSQLGKEQAKLLAKRFAKEDFDIIYASDLRRVKQTIQPLRTGCKTRIIYTPALRERHFGSLEGKQHSKIDFVHEEITGRLSGKTRAETIEQFYRRNEKFLKHIMKKHAGKKVLIVAHGGNKLAFISMLKNIPFHRMYDQKTKLSNTSVTVVSFKGKKHRFHKIGCVKHLKE